MRSKWVNAGLLGVVGSLAMAAVASATFQPTVSYEPPILKFKDFASHNTEENVVVRRQGTDFTITVTPIPPGIDGESDPGCEFILDGVSCPRQGIERLVVLLGGMNDSADVDLGASADKVVQTARGQDGSDKLRGGLGTQKLLGGDGEDILRGGPGDDVLNGGPGMDTCIGGGGEDTLTDCDVVRR